MPAGAVFLSPTNRRINRHVGNMNALGHQLSGHTLGQARFALTGHRKRATPRVALIGRAGIGEDNGPPVAVGAGRTGQHTFCRLLAYEEGAIGGVQQGVAYQAGVGLVDIFAENLRGPTVDVMHDQRGPSEIILYRLKQRLHGLGLPRVALIAAHIILALQFLQRGFVRGACRNGHLHTLAGKKPGATRACSRTAPDDQGYLCCHMLLLSGWNRATLPVRSLYVCQPFPSSRQEKKKSHTRPRPFPCFRAVVVYAWGDIQQGEAMSQVNTDRVFVKKSHPVSAEDIIPVLDLGPFLAGEPGALARLGREVCQALEDIGFFFIKNHGVPQELVDRVFTENARFHALPLERKLSVKVDSKGIGYMPQGLQQPKYSQDEPDRKPDIGEAFFIGREIRAGSRNGDSPDPLYQGGNQWPADLPGFREALVEYYDAMEALSLRLLPVYAAALGLPEHFFDDAFLHSRPMGILRVSHYPGTPCEENQFNASPHIDGDFMTFLAQSEVPGLELRTSEKKWIQAPVLDGTFLVNAGEILRLWSNGRFRATFHRAINRSGRDRYAIPFFYSPSPDTLIECVETCCDADHPPQYRPVTVREYTEWFSHKVFVHLKDKPGRSPYYEGDRPDSAA